MLETLTLITLSVILLIIFRPGKTPPLNNPLVIERAGAYHITLAPQLNLAQPFIEAIAKELSHSPVVGHSAPQYFEVDDAQAKAHGHKAYLLAVTRRNGMSYFQATAPHPENPDYLRTIKEFSGDVLARFEPNGNHDPILDEAIFTAINTVAPPRSIVARHLTA